MTTIRSLPPWLAVALAVVAYLASAAVRRALAPDSFDAGGFARSLDATLLYVVCLVPGFLAAALCNARWWSVGAFAGYLAEVVRLLVPVAIQASQHPNVGDLTTPFVDSLLHAIPSIVFGVAGAALARVPILRL